MKKVQEKGKQKGRALPREEAADVLTGILDQGRLSHLAMRECLESHPEWSTQEKAFFTRLTEGTLEKLFLLDEALNRVSNTPVRKMKPFIRGLMRVSAYQILFMEQVPVSAACNEAVLLAGKRSFSGLKGFVNGVLRNLARRKEEGALDDLLREKAPEEWLREAMQDESSQAASKQKRFSEKDLAELSLLCSMPQWICKHLVKTVGAEKAVQVLSAMQKEPDQCVHIHTSRCSVKEAAGLLKEDGIQVKEAVYLPGEALRVQGSLTETRAFSEGLLQPQDESSMLAVIATGIRKGDRVLDVCAAPGGKSMFAAERAGETGVVLSRDLTEEKAARIRENAARCRFPQVTAQVRDACVPDEDCLEAFDVVIADLPCSGLGIMGRKKDIRYHLKEEQLKDLPALQKKILDVVWHYVKPGGKLLLSTCTINPRENEENRSYLLKTAPFHPVDLSGVEELAPFRGEGTLPEGYLQLLPGVHRCDGFFFSILQRE